MELENLNLHWRYLESLGKVRLLRLLGQCLARMNTASDVKHYRQYAQIDKALSRAYVRLAKKEQFMLSQSKQVDAMYVCAKLYMGSAISQD